jgi:hypothetical protein
MEDEGWMFLLMIALGVILGDSNILVHVEGLDILEADLAGLVGLHQLAVQAERGAACGEPQHKVAIGAGPERLGYRSNIFLFLPLTLILLMTYLAAQSVTLLASSRMRSFIPMNSRSGEEEVTPGVRSST